MRRTSLVGAGLDRTHQAQHLIEADIALNGLRKTLLLCFELELLTGGQDWAAPSLVVCLGATAHRAALPIAGRDRYAWLLQSQSGQRLKTPYWVGNENQTYMLQAVP